MVSGAAVTVVSDNTDVHQSPVSNNASLKYKGNLNCGSARHSLHEVMLMWLQNTEHTNVLESTGSDAMCFKMKLY